MGAIEIETIPGGTDEDCQSSGGAVMRWFGESWGAPINRCCAQVPVPVGCFCEKCAIRIKSTDQGFELPLLVDVLPATEEDPEAFMAVYRLTVYHKICWFALFSSGRVHARLPVADEGN